MSTSDPHTQPKDRTASKTDGDSNDHPDKTVDAPARPDSGSKPGSGRQYRAFTATLLVLGTVFLVFGLLLDGTAVLFALGGIGIFGGVLSYYMTLDRFVAAEVDERIQAAAARNYEGIRAGLGLSDRRIYVPLPTLVDDEADRSRPDQPEVRLLVPKHPELDLEDATELAGDPVVGRNSTALSGLSLHPSGEGLFAAFRAALNTPLETDPEGLSRQLSDAVVEEFDLARSVTADISPEQEQMSVTFSDVLYDTRPRFDHPLVSVFAVGLAVGLDSPIETTVPDTDSFSVTFHWSTDTEPSADDPEH